MARLESTNFKTTKLAGYVKEIDVVDESDEEIQRVLLEKDAPEHKEVNKIYYSRLPSLRSFYILHEYFSFRYNISFIDPPLEGFGEIFPSVMIFPSGNISPNPPRSRSINDRNYSKLLTYQLFFIVTLS